MSRAPSPRSVVRIGATAFLALGLLAGCSSGGDATERSTTSTTAGPEGDATSPAPSGSDGDAAAIDCPAPSGELAPFGADVVTVVDEGGVEVHRCVVVADTGALRSQGLMGITDLSPYDAMVFAYAGTSAGGYWMKDTPMPLSIAWIGVDGRIVATADMEPCLDRGNACPSYEPGIAYRWAIEVPQGGLAAFGLRPGAMLAVDSLPAGGD